MTQATIEPILKLRRDIKNSVVTLTAREVRYLVDFYYQIQENRKRSANQVRAGDQEPGELLTWLFHNMQVFERNIKSAMASYSQSHPVGRWAESIHGIGPVLSAGLLAHINIKIAPTVAHIWRFAGLDPTVEWGKGQVRPWNAKLKTLCWKIGESFVKVHNSDKDFYGRIYAERKEVENRMNKKKAFRDQAKNILSKRRIGKDTDAYKSYSKGQLPPAHIHARAKRWAVKMFLSHWHWVAYEVEHDAAPPAPFIIQFGGHRDFTAPPNWKSTHIDNFLRNLKPTA